MFIIIKKLPFILMSVPLSLALVFFLSVLLKCGSGVPVNNMEKPTDECAAFLYSHGWHTSPDPFEVYFFTLPEEFDDVYLQYNSVQINQGFDLLPYRGKCVEKRVYEVFDYPGRPDDDTIRANVYVFDNKIIGADICSVRIDGFLHEVIWDGNEKNENG